MAIRADEEIEVDGWKVGKDAVRTSDESLDEACREDVEGYAEP
jgi:hypothetical protein